MVASSCRHPLVSVINVPRKLPVGHILWCLAFSMAKIVLSEAEKLFILHGIQDNMRTDGRGCEDFRSMEIETDIVSNTSGSARMRMSNTDVLVGIKAEMDRPSRDYPNQGRLEFFVDCSANAAPEFEGRGGEELATEISNTLLRAYSFKNSLDLQSLCLVPKEQCWVLYIDIVLLECGGNLFDAVSIAVKAALYNTRIPNVTINTDDPNKTELEISDDPYDFRRLSVKNSPCIVTLSKIGHHHIIDAMLEEEACCLARIIVGVTEQGTYTLVKKEGAGSLDPESIVEMLESAKRVGQKMNVLLMKKLEQEEKLPSNLRKCGFLK